MLVITRNDFHYNEGDFDVDPVMVFKHDENIHIQVCDYAEEIGQKYNVVQETNSGFNFYPQKTLGAAIRKVAYLHLGGNC